MKLFGWKGAAVSPRPALSRAFAIGGASMGEWPAHYEAQVRDAILGNPVAQRAVRLVSEAAGGAALRAQGADEAAQARLLSFMRATSGGQGLVETLALHLMLHGNAYVQILTDAAGDPAELYALRPERVSVELDRRGWPIAYGYRTGNMAVRLLAVDGADERGSVIHLKAINPLDDHYGLGCINAASGAVAIHNAATVWNKALLDNAARPSGALVYAPGDGSTLSPEGFDRLKAEMEAGYAGAANAGRPMLLEGGLSWQAMSLTPAEMDFGRARDTASREIALAFGVPPMLLGLPGDNSYANYAEANVALWRLTLLPLTARILTAIAEHLHDWWPGLELRIDRDAIPALSVDRERLWAQVAAANFLSDDEKRGLLGLGSLNHGAA